MRGDESSRYGRAQLGLLLAAVVLLLLPVAWPRLGPAASVGFWRDLGTAAVEQVTSQDLLAGRDASS